MKKTLLFVLLIASIICIFAISVSAAETKTIDGLTYYINNKTAELTNANKSCTLETVIIPETIKDSSGNDCVVNRINENAFNGNKTIKYVSLPPTITFIGPAAFHSCSSLEFVDFNDNPNDVDFNNWGHFMNCTSLKAISLPDNVDYITNRMFSGCNALEAVYLPSAAVTLETNGYGNHTLFYECFDMYFVNEPFEVRDENGNFYGDSFVMPERPDIYYMPSQLVNIFNRDTGIGFASCYSLNPVIVFPETLTRLWINDGVFYECGKTGNKFTVVFLGDMTDVRIGMRDHRARGISYVFANPADKDLSCVNLIDSSPTYYPTLNGDERIFFCASGKYFNLYNLGGGSDASQYTNENTTLLEGGSHLVEPKRTVTTEADCVNNAAEKTFCF